MSGVSKCHRNEQDTPSRPGLCLGRTPFPGFLCSPVRHGPVCPEVPALEGTVTLSAHTPPPPPLSGQRSGLPYCSPVQLLLSFGHQNTVEPGINTVLHRHLPADVKVLSLSYHGSRRTQTRPVFVFAPFVAQGEIIMSRILRKSLLCILRI